MEPAEHLDQCLTTGQAGAPADTLWRLSDDELEELVEDLDAHLNQTHAWLAHAIAEAEHRSLAERRHILSTRQWVRMATTTTKTRADRLVKGARSLPHMPNVAKGMLAGEVDPHQAAILTTAHAKHPDAFAIHEETFAAAARDLDPHDLRKVVEHWRQQVDHPAALHDIAVRRNRRRMSLHQTFDGMWRHDADYDPESGHIISTALHTHTDPGNLDPDDHRTHPQRMVDALTDICRSYLDHNTDAASSGGEKPHITITVDYHALTNDSQGGRLPEIDGTPVDIETVKRLACDAGIVRIITDGASEPLDVGRRTRTVTPAIRRALDHRDQGCVWHGCDTPARWTDAHHLTHWLNGGATSLDNLILVCRRHHTAIHHGTTTGLPQRFLAKLSGADPP